MIHHVSFGVSEPKCVAEVLAALTQATAVRAPTPPFPCGAWLVVAGDEQGSFIEILRATSVFDPDAPLGIRQRPATYEPVSAHVLISAAVTGEVIHAAAVREGWRAEEVETDVADAACLAKLAQKEAAGRYFGEVDLQFEYKGLSGAPFSVLHVDYETLARIAGRHGWRCELIANEGGHYLARTEVDGCVSAVTPVHA